MPTTVNGIGTHYYGQRNLRIHQGQCENCGRVVTLRDYETRLCFVILLIPIIPLGRKQVINECPRCRRHRVMPLEKWTQLREELVEESKRQTQAAPNDVQAALDHLQTVTALRGAEKAVGTARETLERFGDRADVQVAAGGCYEHLGMGHEADACFERALSLDPHDGAARRAVAMGCIERNELERAAQLLDAMERDEQPDRGPPFVLLGEAYQKQGQHEEALDAFRRGLAAAPSLKRERSLRKMVRQSEKVAPDAARALPPKRLWEQPAFLAAGIASLVALAVFGANWLIASRRPLHVVNSLSIPATVRLDGAKPMQIAPGALRKTRCGEGHHEAVVALEGGQPETVRFTMATGWFARFFRKPVYVLNVGGAAVIVREEIIYSVRRKEQANPFELHCGEPFVAFKHIHYAFTDPPSRIESEGTHDVHKSCLYVVEDIEPGQALNACGDELSSEACERFARSHLTAQPKNDLLLNYLFFIMQEEGRTDVLRDFLEQRLDNRPVLIQWHRRYQALCDTPDRWGGLVEMYEGFLRRDPDNSALLYLRGRLVEAPEKALPYHERAIAADPSNPYPHLAKAWHLRSAGDFAAARRAVAEAHRLRPDQPEIEAAYYRDRLRLGEFDALEQEVRSKRRETPLLWDHHIQLMGLLAAKGDLPAARREHEAYAARVRQELPGDPDQLVLSSEVSLLAFEGRYEECLAKLEELGDAGLVEGVEFRCRLELAQLDAAQRSVAEAEDAYGLLLVAIAWGLEGNRERAAVCRRRAAEALATQGRRERQLAAFLAEDAKPTAADVRAVTNAPFVKALAAAALAQAHPAEREGLLEVAEKFNVSPVYPHAFLKRAVTEMRTASAAHR
jgi:tetratricopeptide (TPR) repeat protein